MSTGQPPAFRLDNDQLALRFTATLSDRHLDSVERLPTADRLDDWLAANGLDLGAGRATPEELLTARRLREAIHRCGTALVAGDTPASADLELINSIARDGQIHPELTASAMQWRTHSGHPVEASLAVIALDAVVAFGGPHRGHLKACENRRCGGLYVDASQAQRRRWCSMNTCGNQAKKAKFRA